MPKITISENLFDSDVGSTAPLTSKPIQFQYSLAGANNWQNVGSPVATDTSGNATSPATGVLTPGQYDLQGVFAGDATTAAYTAQLLGVSLKTQPGGTVSFKVV